jgi:SAM-dependent methyltransferase
MLVEGLPPLSPRLRAREPERFGAEVERHFRLVRRALSLHRTFLQVSADDCALARRVAGYVERAYALGPQKAGAANDRAPNIVRMVAHDGAVPLPEGSVDVAFSAGLLERLSGAAARAHLAAVRRALAPGGSYFCLTAGRIHSAAELRRRLREAGFRTVRFYGRLRRWYAVVPYPLLRLAEVLAGGRLARLQARAA